MVAISIWVLILQPLFMKNLPSHSSVCSHYLSSFLDNSKSYKRSYDTVHLYNHLVRRFLYYTMYES